MGQFAEFYLLEDLTEETKQHLNVAILKIS